MHSIFMRHAANQYPYDWNRGPGQVRSERDARIGANCVALSHLVIKDLFGVSLPSGLHCAEMYKDMIGPNQFFVPNHRGVANMRLGDVVWLGWDWPTPSTQSLELQYGQDGFLENWTELPFRHVVTYTGETQFGEPLMLHTSDKTGVEIASLAAIMSTERHAKIHGVGTVAAACVTVGGTA